MRVTLLLSSGTEAEVDLEPGSGQVCLRCGAVDPQLSCGHTEVMDAGRVLVTAYRPPRVG